VVPAVRCIRSVCERKLIHSHPNNSRHPFFQPNCKSIMVMPMNMKESDNFFWRLRWSVGHFSSKIVNFVFPSKMLNFAISSVFRPKRISCVPNHNIHQHNIYNSITVHITSNASQYIYIVTFIHHRKLQNEHINCNAAYILHRWLSALNSPGTIKDKTDS